MKTLKINCPEGYEIDQEKSNLSEGVVEFKKKRISYNEIAKIMFYNTTSNFFIDSTGKASVFGCITSSYLNTNIAKSKKQLESILALNKLCNVAYYLNDGWVPDWKDEADKTCLFINQNGVVDTEPNVRTPHSDVYFKTVKLAKKAIKILGEEEIKKALTLNH